MPDPKLKTAMEEIKAVLKKHDIGGVVVLASETHMEYLHEIAPTWSCVRFEAGEGGVYGVRVRALAKDFPSKQAHQKCLSDSIGMIMGFANALEHSRELMMVIIRMVGNKIPFEHMTKHEPPAPHCGYSIDLSGPSITCHTCGRTSHNPNDVREKFCGYCNKFHEV